MKELPQNVLELPLHVRALMALEEAVAEVIEDHVRRGIPIYIWRDGKVVDILPEELQKRAESAKRE